jgi:ribonuclease P/MRP protein subunit RPP1
MKYDLCMMLEGPEEIKRSIDLSGRLGWNGAGLLTRPENFEQMKKQIKKLKIPEHFDVVAGLVIEAKKPARIRRAVTKMRKQTELLVVLGGDTEINRAAVETAGVDILLNPWFKRQDPGINHITARFAAENNVAIGFGFSRLLHSYGRSRATLLSNMVKAAEFVRKYKAPFTLTSGALSKWDLISPSDMASLGRVLGFSDPEIKKAISDDIVKRNREKLSGKWLQPGVKVE